MRRLILEEPYSLAAIWTRRVAIFAMAVGGIDLILARGGVEPTAVLAVLGATIFVACVALLCAGAAAVIIWRSGRKGTGVVVAGVFFALLVLAYPAYLAVQAIRLPILNDVSTDIGDPPAFSRTNKALRARGGLTPETPPLSVREAQRRAYPLVQPVLLDLDADEAYQAVLKAIGVSRWQIVDQIPPPAAGRSRLGHIDAVDRSLVFGFPDDITIRIRPLAGQTRIDLRSASRIGRHDFGANARRIEKFAAELQDEVGAK